MNYQRLIPILCFVLIATPALAYEPGELFEPVVDVLEEQFFYRDFRDDGLPELAAYWRPKIRNSTDLEEETRLVHEFLAMIPVSHLALISRNTYRKLSAELVNERTETFGFSLVDKQGNYYVTSVMEEGPADIAGLKRWDRIVRIQGRPTARSLLLDRRSDDAALPDDPKHAILCLDDDPVRFQVERAPGETFTVQFAPDTYSAILAAKNSACIYEYRGKSYGYIHFWYMHLDGIGPLLESTIKDSARKCDGFILDIRGRGGYSASTSEVLDMLRMAKKLWGENVTVLIDHGTRSAKEILAFEIKKRELGVLVGETTAGAVLPAGFEYVGNDIVLMFPVFSHSSYRPHHGTGMSLAEYSVLMEGKGVKPHLEARDLGPHDEVGDAILKAALDYLNPDPLETFPTD